MTRKSIALGKLIFDADKPGAPEATTVWRIERKFKAGWRGPYRVYPYEYPGCAKVDRWFSGPDGALVDYGLVSDPDLAATQAAVKAGTLMAPLK